MRTKYIFIATVMIITGIWLFIAQSLLEVEEGSSPVHLVVHEGLPRTEDDVARILAGEMGFDLEGAYKSGFTSADVIEFLIKEPHKYPVSSYNGKYYEGRVTVLRIIPLGISTFFVIAGILLIVMKLKHKR